MRRLILVLTVVVLTMPLILTAVGQTPTFASRMLVNNERVQIQRLSVPAGFRETLQVVPNDQIAIQITPGDLEVQINGQKTTGRIEPGTTFYVPKNAPHQFLNVGTAPYDVVVVMIK